MFEQISSPFIAATKQFAEAGFKAQGIALEGFEKVVGAQIITFENRLNATLDFWSQASEVRNLDGVKAIMPKSMALAKDTAETVFATTFWETLRWWLSRPLTNPVAAAGKPVSVCEAPSGVKEDNRTEDDR